MNESDGGLFIYLGYFPFALGMTAWIFILSNKKRFMSGVLMRAGVLAFFFTPCFLIGHGGAGILPAGIALFDIITGTLSYKTYLGVALVTMAVSFLLCSAVMYAISDPNKNS